MTGISALVTAYNLLRESRINPKLSALSPVRHVNHAIHILSKNAVTSKWLQIEWSTKFWDEVEKQKIYIIPLLLEDCKIPQLLKNKKYVDFRPSEENDYSTGLNKIVDAIFIDI